MTKYVSPSVWKIDNDCDTWHFLIFLSWLICLRLLHNPTCGTCFFIYRFDGKFQHQSFYTLHCLSSAITTLTLDWFDIISNFLSRTRFFLEYILNTSSVMTFQACFLSFFEFIFVFYVSCSYFSTRLMIVIHVAL